MTEASKMSGAAHSAGKSRCGTHRLECFHGCHRRYAYAELLGLVPLREPDNRARGALGHIGCMWHYLRVAGLANEDPIQKMREAPLRVAHKFETVAPAVKRLMAQPVPFRVLDVEREYEATIGGWPITTRLDVVTARDGYLDVIDNKFLERMFRTGFTFRLSLQMAVQYTFGQFVLAPMYGLPFRGVWINGIGVGSALGEYRLVKLDMDPLFVRARIAAAVDLNRQIVDMVARYPDPWDWPATGPCKTVFGICEYLRLCERGKIALDEFEVSRDFVSNLDLNNA